MIYPIYSSDTKNWHVCSFYNNQPFIINVDATKLTLVTTPLAATVTAEDGLYTGMTNPLTVTFTNSMDMEFNGLVKIYTNTKDNTKPSSPDFDLYITIPARGSVTRQIELPETSSSQQYLWITDVANKEAVIVNGQHFTLTTLRLLISQSFLQRVMLLQVSLVKEYVTAQNVNCHWLKTINSW